MVKAHRVVPSERLLTLEPTRNAKHFFSSLLESRRPQPDIAARPVPLVFCMRFGGFTIPPLRPQRLFEAEQRPPVVWVIDKSIAVHTLGIRRAVHLQEDGAEYVPSRHVPRFGLVVLQIVLDLDCVP